ncbi:MULTISPECIES: class I SAM-dependent methyltransferase [Pseudomonas fluorescens group]|uniref:Class I SAM-dependent methyltransferase n=1 Tax=Pseudomonas petroselini TaxID=2899822 RepID=A0ABS8R056_9PSED|nr:MULTISPECIES: class I SAM-dependent methyltransferase [Pseudomonas fluorescens group]MCD7041360.1 class I SAM-dependent methyltransferase [Pseudomonas petroselini]MCD7046518.1 class I SAM-dependent methyltransferase [Pseudomonas petroselini]MCD7072088.1 class I SAM-dependent methyltransferase [Pseudomonas petroselini]MCD7078343.1 class I SAM-dependent methyltransferase [Pseudomonas petroselini]MCF5668415.1 methyltransferase domain-containing protein [Pseudomonas marginalis]
MTGVHTSAQQGFSTQAVTYAQGRPDYPRQLTGWLAETLRIDAQSSVVDLGAGTGKFTRLLSTLAPTLTAVEPVAAMGAQLRKLLPDVRLVNGTAESIPLPSASADAVVCAQAFHWFSTEAALAEIHRVLKPGGRLGLVWNVRDESVDWVAAITDIITPYEGDTPRFHTGLWREAFNGVYFSAPDVTYFPYNHVGSPQEVIMDRFLSVSFIAALADGPKASVTAQLQALIDTHPALKGRDTVAFPYQTQAYVCHRLS